MNIQPYINLVKDFRSNGINSEPDFENATFVAREGKGISINKNGDKVIEGIVNLLLKDLKRHGFIDEKNIEKYFFDQCFQLLTDDKLSDEEIRIRILDFIEMIKVAIKKEHQVIIPITGLNLKYKLDLLNYRIISKTALNRDFKSIFNKSEIAKTEYKRLVKTADSFAIAIEAGDPKSLANKHVTKLDLALNIIRLYIPHFWHHNLEVQISVVDKDYVTVNSCYVLDENSVKFGSSLTVRRPLKFELDKRRLPQMKFSQRKYMKLMNYDKLNEILKRNDNIATTLFNSLKWIGFYTREKSLNLKLLYLVFALEGIFINENNNYSSITAAVSEKAAYVIGNNKDTRLRIFNFVKMMYGKRGAIVHGSGAIIDSEELINMYEVLLNCFCNLAKLIEKQNIKTIEELNKFITSEKFK